MSLLILFILGVCIGSFLGVLVDRIPFGKSFLAGRSHCDYCKQKLSFLDLIPLLSFAFLKGKCRYCHRRLSIFYPAIELMTGILFVFTYWFVISNFQFPISNQLFNSQFLNLTSSIINPLSLIFYLFIVSGLIVVFFTDIKYGIIPDKIIFPSVLVTLVWLFINHLPAIASQQALQAGQSLIFNHLLSSLGAGLFFIAVPYLYFLLTKITRHDTIG